MSIKFFYNFCLKEDDTNLDGDILSGLRRSYFETFSRIKDKITINSDADYASYEYTIEKDKPMKWEVRASDGALLQDVALSDGGKYFVYFYDNNALYKRVLFSRLHTLLRVEYFDKPSGVQIISLEPRKAQNSLCILYDSRTTPQPYVLYPEPEVSETIRQKAMSFDDYTVRASTDDGIVRFMSEEQLAAYRAYVDKLEQEELKAEEESFVDGETPLFDRINAKDFNVRRNLNTAFDITLAAEFASAPAEDPEPETDTDMAEAEAPEISQEAIPDTDVPAAQEESAVSAEPAEDEPIAESAPELEEAGAAEAEPSEQTEQDTSEPSESEAAEAEPALSEEPEAIEPADTEASDDSTDEATPEESAPEEITPEESAPEESVPEESVPEESASEEPSDEASDFTPADEAEPDSAEKISEAQPDKLIVADGAVYTYYGELDSNGNRSGYGRTLTEYGRTAYEGCYLNDKRSGNGSYYYKDGSLCYTGDWYENVRHGVGVGVSSRDGSIHAGRWSLNKPKGNGVRLTEDGDIKFVCKELSDGTTVLMNFMPDDSVFVAKYDEKGKKIGEERISLSDFLKDK